MSVTHDGADGPIDGTRTITGFVTYMGDGFAAVRSAPERGASPTPSPASTRRYLRDGLPGVYRDEDFGMRFVSSFERVLDPVVALLDNLHAHFDPELAPLDILELSMRWLGLKHNEAQPAAHLRTVVRRAAELGRLRGTRSGMELALRLNFPELALRVEDGGGVAYTIDGKLPQPSTPSFVVYCEQPVAREEAASIARVIEALKPVHVAYRLRIKGPKREKTATS